jgi:glycogen operon protein
MTELVQQLTQLRRRYPQLRPRHWLAAPRTGAPREVMWFTPEATEMTEPDWNFPEGRFLAYVLGTKESWAGPLLIVINGAAEAVPFKFPAWEGCGRWTCEVATVPLENAGAGSAPGESMPAPPRSVTVFSGAP